MTDLLKPEIRVESDEADYALIVAEPLEKGFGTTLGNSLRRVLLSSLPGAAITSVRLEGVEHEFSTIEGMKEDVTEFLLNLKEVRLRAFSDRPARLFLEVGGPGEVTAGQIEATADYEIVNPELVLASLDSKEASLVVDLNVETGRGYLPATVSEGLPIGVIPVDAIFTPVRRVNFRVGNTRVGQDTNFDRLELEIWTDGTIDGQQALSMASEILREQLLGFQLLSGEVHEVAPVQEDLDYLEGHDMPIEQLQLSVRAYNCLKRSGLMTVGAVLEKSEEELLALRNFGEKSYFELKEKLVTAGFPAPRTDSRNDGSEMAPAAVATEAPAAMADDDDDAEEVGALGAALMEALKEADRESN
ncbi:MAG: DNA-directed RNA polymerase subunit alpha [Chloroflexi bacterium]|nr:DNA-directed RNA polymerase subunit alpha [Chloroflexota bacterium]MDA1145460.1 DNA-directed RNA polymerase subunit alpha [Chloroflexota bacterium]